MRTRIALVATIPVALIIVTSMTPLARSGASTVNISSGTSHKASGTHSAESVLARQLVAFHAARNDNTTVTGPGSSFSLTAELGTTTTTSHTVTPPAPAPSPPPGPVTDATSTATGDWECIRIHESGDRYNSSSAPSGAYGIVPVTWHSFGYGGWPYEAPAAIQDALALKLYNEYGWQPWSTRFACGL